MFIHLWQVHAHTHSDCTPNCLGCKLCMCLGHGEKKRKIEDFSMAVEWEGEGKKWELSAAISVWPGVYVCMQTGQKKRMHFPPAKTMGKRENIGPALRDASVVIKRTERDNARDGFGNWSSVAICSIEWLAQFASGYTSLVWHDRTSISLPQFSVQMQTLWTATPLRKIKKMHRFAGA